MLPVRCYLTLHAGKLTVKVYFPLPELPLLPAAFFLAHPENIPFGLYRRFNPLTYIPLCQFVRRHEVTDQISQIAISAVIQIR